MYTPEIDRGERCDRHVGEVFAVRCVDCDVIELKHAAAVTELRLKRKMPGSGETSILTETERP